MVRCLRNLLLFVQLTLVIERDIFKRLHVGKEQGKYRIERIPRRFCDNNLNPWNLHSCVALLIALSDDACPRSILISHMNYKVVFIVRVQMYVHKRMYVCMWVCMYVCMYVCRYVCMYAWMYVYICIRIYTYVCTCMPWMHFNKYSYQLITTLNPTALNPILPIEFYQVVPNPSPAPI